MRAVLLSAALIALAGPARAQTPARDAARAQEAAERAAAREAAALAARREAERRADPRWPPHPALVPNNDASLGGIGVVRQGPAKPNPVRPSGGTVNERF